MEKNIEFECMINYHLKEDKCNKECDMCIDLKKQLSSKKQFWIINQHTYKIDGNTIKKGCMKLYTSKRTIGNWNNWRLATQDEIDTKKYHNGNYYNLKNV